MLAVPSLVDLADFTGRPAAVLGDFAPQALAQATLLFTVVTKLSDYPADPDGKLLATYAILEMADRLLLEQPYASIKAGPFQTETIGSYSYSRSTVTATKVQTGVKSGLFWWDLAVDELSVAGASLVSSFSIQAEIGGIEQAEDGGFLLRDPGAVADRPPYIRIS